MKHIDDIIIILHNENSHKKINKLEEIEISKQPYAWTFSVT